MEIDISAVPSVWLVTLGRSHWSGPWHSPFHTDQLQIATKVASIQSTDRQTVSKTSHGSLEVTLVKVGIQARSLLYGSVHVRPDQGDGGARDATTFVGNLDRNVFFALRDDDLGDREGILVCAVGFHDRTQGVLQGFKEHMGQVTRNIHEVQIFLADKLHFGGIKETIVILTDEASVVDSLKGDLAHIGFRTDDTDIVWLSHMRLFR